MTRKYYSFNALGFFTVAHFSYGEEEFVDGLESDARQLDLFDVDQKDVS